MSPSRTEQACGADGPHISRLKEQVRVAFGLAENEVASDHLVACGMGEPRPDDVAACSRRFLDQGVAPQVVALVGKNTAALAELAGLIDQNMWQPAGAQPAPVVVTDEEHLIRDIAAVLGGSPKPLSVQSRAALAALAPDLYNALGKSEGRAIKRPSKDWVRRTHRRLMVTDIERHLKGLYWAAPFHPKGPWPFVVLDVDRHDALQEQSFNATMNKLAQLLPGSFVVQSSSNGGRHVYVRLPDNVRYDNAALWMRAFLLLKDCRFADVTADNKRIRTELVEVKSQPPRLPFGLGSEIPGSSLTLEDQLKEFLRWLQNSNGSAYTKAADEALKAAGVSPGWKYSDRKKLTAWVLKREAGTLNQPTALDPTDPWYKLKDLPAHVEGVVAAGIPAHGTRTTWTLALIDELTLRVIEPEARVLMEFWLRHRTHQSTDIADDLEQVVAETRERVAARYKRIRGIPLRIWMDIDALVRRDLQDARANPQKYRHLKNPQGLVDEEVLATAFFIARRYFERGVQSRHVPQWEFAEFAGKNLAHDVQEVLSYSMSWLHFWKSEVPGASARQYNLKLWPAIPGEDALVVPPFGLPPRSRSR